MKRITQIDCIRGLMLVIMTVDHLQYMAFSRLSEHTINFTYQTFGFVAAVEGFVFLSGLVFGLVYTPKLINDESNFNRVVWRRWRLIYYYHLGLLLILATLFSIPWFAQIWSHPWSNIALLHTEPWWSAATGAVFLYQPSYLDILPMYLAFVALSPLVLRMLQRGRAKLLAAIVIACYLAVQIFHPQFVLSASLSNLGFYLGWFELLSWQLLFFGGVWLGFAHKKNPNFRIPIKRNWIIIAAIIAAPLMWYRHQFNLPFGALPYFDDLFRDRNLGIIRIINAAALAYLLYSLCHAKPTWLQWKWLRNLGENSLQVFAFHVLLCYTTNPLRDWLAGVPLWLEFILLLTATATLSLPVMLKKRLRPRT